MDTPYYNYVFAAITGMQPNKRHNKTFSLPLQSLDGPTHNTGHFYEAGEHVSDPRLPLNADITTTIDIFGFCASPKINLSNCW